MSHILGIQPTHGACAGEASPEPRMGYDIDLHVLSWQFSLQSGSAAANKLDKRIIMKQMRTPRILLG
jgi:hypothetical protein